MKKLRWSLVREHLDSLFKEPNKLSFEYHELFAAHAFIQTAAFLREDHEDRQKYVEFLLDLAEDCLFNYDSRCPISVYGRSELEDVLDLVHSCSQEVEV